ncbi:cytochrome c biogenesis protein ResB [Tumebacillus sp. DT12]|uniref:Cytochrome c biogenesis protein ResB n=1 Tax=Tumebacillus lacus TaxID=2995335 RepID=A0ABT3X0I4_9BACL|nr:cytochrome c biogenesis protein ResB [Tumebacillus lacus]MCX7569065.1 cytochrome c biogenesis protein ResB [Tumebacillus lacus]
MNNEEQTENRKGQGTDHENQTAQENAAQGARPVRPVRRKGIIESIWDFFASVPVGITIIALLTVGSTLGTIYPQENAIPSPNPEFYYFDTYGKLGEIYFRLGLSHTYTTWWYLTLVLLLAISLVIVSIDRGVPLYKSLKNQPVARKVLAIRGDRLYASKEAAGEEEMNRLGEALKKRRYKIRTEQGALLAEKGRLPRFGAYVIHIGLLIIIAGVFTRLIPGWYYTDMVWIKEGERVPVKELGFSLQNNGFELEYYDQQQTRVKKYETDVAVYEGDQEVAIKHLIVNDPLIYENTYIFQNSFDPSPMFKDGEIQLLDKATQKPLGTFHFDFEDPQPEYKVGDYTLKVVNYYPDIRVDKDMGIYTNSREPYNPGIQFDISGPGFAEPSRQWMMPMAPFVEQMLGAEYKFSLKFQQVDVFHMTGLKLNRDLGIPIVYTGCGVTLWGLVLVFYFQHRRVWARLEDGVLHVGGHTNKNWLGMNKEFNRALSVIDVEPVKFKKK